MTDNSPKPWLMRREKTNTLRRASTEHSKGSEQKPPPLRYRTSPEALRSLRYRQAPRMRTSVPRRAYRNNKTWR